MTVVKTPQISVPPEMAEALLVLARESGSLEATEGRALANGWGADLRKVPGWHRTRQAVLDAWLTRDHLVLRGLPVAGRGASLILGMCLLGEQFRPYRGRKVVKHFTMSPWTRALSHTMNEGHFHTDLNTAPSPPKVTAIQCVTEDPGAPLAGENRVARLPDLVEALSKGIDEGALSFLTCATVSMINDSSPDVWRGRIVQDGALRFHPETLRAAQKRYGDNPWDMEDHLASIRETALHVSEPIHLKSGEILLVSNRRALHYRGACTVRFRKFPRDFESRSIFVAHLMGEPTGSA